MSGSVSGSVIDSFRLEIAIASQRFASLLKSECVWFTQKDLHSIRRTVTLKTLSFQILRYRAPGLGVKIPGYLNTWTPEYLEPGLGFCHVDRLFLEAGRLFPIHHNRGAHWQLDFYRRFLCCKIVASPGFCDNCNTSTTHMYSHIFQCSDMATLWNMRGQLSVGKVCGHHRSNSLMNFTIFKCDYQNLSVNLH